MNGISTIVAKPEDTMTGLHRQSARRNRGQQGQIIVIAALGMVALIGGVSLILEGGNAYAHQRIAQNAADAVANAGATVLAKRLGGDTTQGDASVLAATAAMATANKLDSYTGYYTNVTGALLDTAGLVTTDIGTASQVGPADGDTTIPPGTQGILIGGSQAFGTTFARVIGITQFTASADAAAVTGALTGGVVMPVVFPVSMESCDGTGTSIVIDEPWRLSDPNPADQEAHPIGQEYIVPLCKTGSGSFMILDLDPDKDCEEEVDNPSSIQFNDFPVDVATDTGNDCAKKIEDAIAAQHVQGTVQMIPICDGDCVTSGGSGGTYHIIRMVAFYVDYISYSNSSSNSACERTTSPTYGTSIVQITGGNASSSCIAGWFVRYVTSGPVGTGSINNGEAIGVQLIR
jgi:Flp pilus assembly protein TadG